jgi:hypothetical protein
MAIGSPSSYGDWRSVVYVAKQDEVVLLKYLVYVINSLLNDCTVFMKPEDLSLFTQKVFCFNIKIKYVLRLSQL